MKANERMYIACWMYHWHFCGGAEKFTLHSEAMRLFPYTSTGKLNPLQKHARAVRDEPPKTSYD